MKVVALLGIAGLVLAACGADGEPQAPKLSAETTIGFNSKTGPFNSTSVTVEFGG